MKHLVLKGSLYQIERKKPEHRNFVWFETKITKNINFITAYLKKNDIMNIYRLSENLS